MPSLTLVNSASKASNLKRTQMVVNDPITSTSESIWDDVTVDASSAYSSASTSFLVITSSGAGGYAARVFKVIPYSEYTITAVLATVLSGGDATLEVGTAAGDASLVNENMDAGGVTQVETFNAGANNVIWVTLAVNNSSSVAYWDSIKIEETG